MEPLIDRERIAELDRLMNEPLDEIIGELVQRLDDSIEHARRALGDGDLETVAAAAHHGRNDAMIVGAGPLQRALAELEAAARAGAGGRAGDALHGVERAWSMTRPQLQGGAQAG